MQSVLCVIVCMSAFVRVSNVVPSCCVTVVMCDKVVVSDVVNY